MDIFDKFAEMVVKFVVNKLLDWLWKKIKPKKAIKSCQKIMSDIERQTTEGKKEMVRTQAKEKSQCPRNIDSDLHK